MPTLQVGTPFDRATRGLTKGSTARATRGLWIGVTSSAPFERIKTPIARIYVSPTIAGFAGVRSDVSIRLYIPHPSHKAAVLRRPGAIVWTQVAEDYPEIDYKSPIVQVLAQNPPKAKVLVASNPSYKVITTVPTCLARVLPVPRAIVQTHSTTTNVEV